MKTRAILHVDMDAFFASIEQRDDPALRGQPVVVGAGPHERGVIAAASYEARRFGIHSAMPSRTAYRLCPHAVFVPPHGEKYREASRHVMEILESFTPLIEPVSIDEAFLDVTGAVDRFAGAADIAARIKTRIRERTQLTASVGVAPNKFLAKLASDLEKPDGLTVISEENKLRLLEPLPVSKIWGVGQVTEELLRARGFRTIGDLQRCRLDDLRARFGNLAFGLHALARGEDDRPVEVGGERKSISSEHTFDQDTSDLEAVRRRLLEQAEDVGAQLRQKQLAARTVQIKLRYADFTTITRRKTLETVTQDDMTLYRVAGDLLAAACPPGRFIRLIGLGAANLTPPEFQMDLFDQSAAKRARLARAVDQIRERHGPDALKRGRTL